MSQPQDTLPGLNYNTGVNAMVHKVFPNVVDGSGTAIDHAKWLRAVAESKPVASCRRCGHYCKPEAPTEAKHGFDYTAVCINDAASNVFPRGCRKEFVMPGGRLATKSTRERERPHREPGQS